MNIRICDICSETHPRNVIRMTRRPNDEDLTVELCDQCLKEIVEYADDK